MEVSPPNFRDWQRMSTSFADMGAGHNISVNLVGRGEPRRLDGEAVTFELLRLLGSRRRSAGPSRRPTTRRERPGRSLLSDALWKSQFGGGSRRDRPDGLLDDEPFTIIGVMPAGLRLSDAADAVLDPDAVHRADLRGSGKLLAQASWAG